MCKSTANAATILLVLSIVLTALGGDLTSATCHPTTD